MPGTISGPAKYHIRNIIAGEKGSVMRTALIICILFSPMVQADAFALEPETLDEAKSLAASGGLPILMEFLRPG